MKQTQKHHTTTSCNLYIHFTKFNIEEKKKKNRDKKEGRKKKKEKKVTRSSVHGVKDSNHSKAGSETDGTDFHITCLQR